MNYQNKKKQKNILWLGVIFFIIIFVTEVFILTPIQKISLTPKRIETPQLELLSQAQGREYYLNYVPNEAKLLFILIRLSIIFFITGYILYLIYPNINLSKHSKSFNEDNI